MELGTDECRKGESDGGFLPVRGEGAPQASVPRTSIPFPRWTSILDFLRHGFSFSLFGGSKEEASIFGLSLLTGVTEVTRGRAFIMSVWRQCADPPFDLFLFFQFSVISFSNHLTLYYKNPRTACWLACSFFIPPRAIYFFCFSPAHNHHSCKSSPFLCPTKK